MVEHPSLGRHIDEVQIDAHAVSRAVVLSGSSTLQEYFDGACSISYPLWPIIEKGFLLQANLVSGRDSAT